MAAIQAEPWHRSTPNPVEHADYWIQVQILREPWHPHWWKELKALYRDSAGDLHDAQALQVAWWQATAF